MIRSVARATLACYTGHLHIRLAHGAQDLVILVVLLILVALATLAVDFLVAHAVKPNSTSSSCVYVRMNGRFGYNLD